MEPDDQKITIIRDTREKSKFGWTFASHKKCECLDLCLKLGDYTVKGLEDKLVIERKHSVSELALCLGVGKADFWQKIEKMSKFKYPFLILEFSLSDVARGSKFSRLSPGFLIKEISEIIIKYKIPVIFLGNTKKAEYFIYKMIRKVYECEFVQN